MAAPTLADSDKSTFNDSGTTDETAGSVAWETGDIVLVFGLISNNDAAGTTLATPTVAGLTFSLVTSLNVNSEGNDCTVYLWSATAGSASSGTIGSVTNTGTSSLRSGIVVQVWRGSDGIGTPATIDNSTAKTISVTTTQANSRVAWAMGDWNAVNDVTVTATPSGTIQHAQFETGQSTFFAGYTDDLVTVAAHACGIASHTGTVDMAGIAVEIKGTAGGGGTTPKNRFGKMLSGPFGGAV